MKKLLKKLKSQKGATGTDVLIAAAMIVLAVGIVSMLYVNTSIQSKNITRTSGATRIATNLIENIDAMSYEEFLGVFAVGSTEITVDKVGTKTGVNATYASSEQIFNTKIPTGFAVTIKAPLVYGSHTVAQEKFDLVRQVEVLVSYDVGKTTEQVNFSTVKQREMISECNAPATGDLRNGFLQSGMNYYPIKYVSSINAYLKTTEDDPEWYNYTNKEWATVIISRKNENEIFDPNGKFIGTINVATDNAAYTQKAVWVPRYFTNGTSSNKNVLFAFNAKNNEAKDKAIQSATLTASGATLNYYKVVEQPSGWNNVDVNYFSDTQTGRWTLVKADNTLNTSDTFVPALNGSQYGPCTMH